MLVFLCPSCYSVLADKQLIWETKMEDLTDTLNDSLNEINVQKEKLEDVVDDAKYNLEILKLENKIKQIYNKHEDNIQQLLTDIGLIRLCCRMRMISYTPLINIIK